MRRAGFPRIVCHSSRFCVPHSHPQAFFNVPQFFNWLPKTRRQLPFRDGHGDDRSCAGPRLQTKTATYFVYQYHHGHYGFFKRVCASLMNAMKTTLQRAGVPARPGSSFRCSMAFTLGMWLFTDSSAAGFMVDRPCRPVRVGWPINWALKDLWTSLWGCALALCSGDP